jgi:hypothetical protein
MNGTFEKCPYPECALSVDHDGDHVPRLTLVQRYSYRPTANGEFGAMFPGFCEGRERECVRPAVALYRTADGRTVDLCEECADEYAGGSPVAMERSA